MASENNLNAVFTDIANAIRDKKGSVNTIKPINMADEILTIETGGGKSTIYKLLEARGTDWSNAFYVYSSNKNIFYYMTELSESDLPPSNNVINMPRMFYNCVNLTSIPLIDTSSCTSTNNMFYYCKLLTSIPALNTSSCTSMSQMFYYCYILEKIDITKLVSGTNYNNYFASNCYSLKTLIIRTMDTIPTLNSNAFQNCYHFYGTQDGIYNPNGLKDGRIYVPDDKVASLKTATNWSVFADIIKPLSEYVE